MGTVAVGVGLTQAELDGALSTEVVRAAMTKVKTRTFETNLVDAGDFYPEDGNEVTLFDNIRGDEALEAVVSGTFLQMLVGDNRKVIAIIISESVWGEFSLNYLGSAAFRSVALRFVRYDDGHVEQVL